MRLGSALRMAMMASISASVLPKMRTASRADFKLPSAVCWSEVDWSTACCEAPPKDFIFWARASVVFWSFSTPAAAISVDSACEKIGTVDGEQHLILLDLVADIGNGGDDAALVGREDLRQHVLIEIDVADRLPLDDEGSRSDDADA